MENENRSNTHQALKLSEKEALRTHFKQSKDNYDRLAGTVRDAIQNLLTEKHIPFLDVMARVKDIDSAIAKAERKKYSFPFDQIEDWCGIRVICYYPSDVDRIINLLTEEFDVEKVEDTALRLQAHEFGYRSTHLILKIKPSWLSGPVYRGLGSIKAEVQVRTILMHAWAEIEHKLAYKSAEQVPDQFKRKLYRLSAKFEEADEQFEELRVGLSEYRNSVRVNAEKDTKSVSAQDLNLDSLQSFLDTVYQQRNRSLDDTAELLNELIDIGLTLSDVVDAYERTLPIFEKIEASECQGRNTFWSQIGAIRTALDTASDKYYQYREIELGDFDEWTEAVDNSRSFLKNYESAK